MQPAPVPSPVPPASPASKIAAPHGRMLAAWTLVTVGSVVAYELIRAHGETLLAPAAASAVRAAAGAAQAETLLHVLLALVVVIVTARVIGTLFRALQQPPVVGEILAGVLLGPSLLGRVAPSVAEYLLPPAVAPFLGVLSQVGVILYMFLVGLELDPSLLRKRGQATLTISHASIVLPFVLGAALALGLYPRLSTRDVSFTSFSLFLGVSMSVTAFPVLARILTDRRVHRTRMGVIALTCAAIDDVTAWCLLAFVVSVVQAELGGALRTVLLAGGYIAAMGLVVRPIMLRLARLYGTRGRLTQGLMAIVFVALLLSSLATDLIGIHAVFGAFALGAVIPHDSGLARDLTERLEDLVVVLLLPAFFAFTGMRTEIGLVSTAGEWLLCGLIIAVASIGKFGGSALAARLAGLPWRDATALGALMNTRGLMELIVLNIGLELRVISPALFAMLVVMALVTTLMTTPIFHAITRRHRLDEARAPEAEPAEAQRGRRVSLVPGAAHRRGVLVPITNPDDVLPLVDLACAATRDDDPRPHVLSLVRRPPGGVRSGLREIDQREPPQTRGLAAALEAASRLDATVEARARWTDDPARDIVGVAHAEQVRWLILGFHRPIFGHDALGGVVGQVLERAGRDVDVAIAIHGHEAPIARLVVVVDRSADGHAAVELAVRIAKRKACALHAVLVPDEAGEPGPVLEELVRTASRAVGRWIHTDALRHPGDEQHALARTEGELVIAGAERAEALGLLAAESSRAPDRRVIAVRGSAARAALLVPGQDEESRASAGPPAR